MPAGPALTRREVEVLQREANRPFADLDGVADMLRISRRSVYRYRRGELLTLTVGSWQADYLVDPSVGPRRLGPWRRTS